MITYLLNLIGISNKEENISDLIIKEELAISDENETIEDYLFSYRYKHNT